MAKYRYGLFLNPQPNDPMVDDDLPLAESRAREMSLTNNGTPVAVWADDNTTLTLFAGYEQFKPVREEKRNADSI